MEASVLPAPRIDLASLTSARYTLQLLKTTATVCLAFVLRILGPGSATAATDRLEDPPKPAVVLVHGIWNTGRMFDPMVQVLRQQGYSCFASDLQPNDARNGLRDLSARLAAQIDARFGPRQPLVLVGFSMGGLVARDYVENVLSNPHRVRGVFLIASAAKGTFWANLSPRAGQRQMGIGSPFLRELNANQTAWQSIPVHSYWTPLDLMVVPAVNSRWPEGDTTRVLCPLHPWMVRDPRVIADVAARLRDL